MASEKNFENRVKNFLKEQDCYFFKYWGGGEFTKAGIIACVAGFYLGIEVKGEKGKPSALQIHNLRKIDDAGGAGILLYPDEFEVFKNFVLCLKASDLVNAQYNYELMKGRWLDWEQRFR